MDFKTLPTYVEDFHDEDSLRLMKFKRLGKTKMIVSQLGFGCGQLGLVYNKPEEKETLVTIKNALKSGVNYIDTAPYYGEGTSEIVLGKALKDIPRKAYYVATKIGRYSQDIKSMFDFSFKRTLESVDISLKKLGVEYIDLIQVHDLEFAPSKEIILKETLPALQQVVQLGKAKYIGITGYPIVDLKEVLEKSTVPIDTVLFYTRCTLIDNTLLQYMSFFKDKGVGIIHAASLGMGLLTPHRPLPDWHPVTLPIREACDKALTYCKDKGVDIAKLALHYTLCQPGIDTHLTGMPNKEDLINNLNTIRMGLTELEQKVQHEIVEKFFKPLETPHWEQVEVRRYWSNK